MRRMTHLCRRTRRRTPRHRMIRMTPTTPMTPTTDPPSTLTVATVPLIGDFSVAPVSAVFAAVTELFAVETFALSAESWASVVVLLSSALARVDWALASVAWACASDDFSDSVSMVARTSPLLTLSPTDPRTDVTSAADVKLTSSSSAGASVPVVETDSRTVPVEAATSLVVTPACAWAPDESPVSR